MQNLYPPSVHELQHGKPPAVFPLAVNNACAEIKDACKALGVDEKALSRVLSTVTPDDRTLIAHRYKELYLEELKFLLKSEVSGDFGFLLQLLAVSLDEAEAYVLHAAVTGPLNTGQIVFPVRSVFMACFEKAILLLPLVRYALIYGVSRCCLVALTQSSRSSRRRTLTSSTRSCRPW